eukprot:CAMPEP_0178739350 /NCGR_PEP_ID=MMETSP0744-20121128/4009_1 /TAXON_ID=913974 /ORGANISM="Nitzschia punctata, Strain CCMP561" /LENGTH=59 /DNA_ID=CAMNT_0020392049 /DNA_START=365 /DNA_END=544 /DNA_ORIENTATION=-
MSLAACGSIVTSFMYLITSSISAGKGKKEGVAISKSYKEKEELLGNDRGGGMGMEAEKN